MLDVFDLRGRVIGEYAAFSRSFTRIAALDIAAVVDAEYTRERYWPVDSPSRQQRLPPHAKTARWVGGQESPRSHSRYLRTAVAETGLVHVA